MGCPYHFLPRMPGHANRTSKDQTGWTRIAWKKNFMVCLLVVREHRGILQRHPKSTGKLACDWKANGSHHLEPTQWAALLPAPPQKSTKHGLIIDCFQRFAIKKKLTFHTSEGTNKNWMSWKWAKNHPPHWSVVGFFSLQDFGISP